MRSVWFGPQSSVWICDWLKISNRTWKGHWLWSQDRELERDDCCHDGAHVKKKQTKKLNTFGVLLIHHNLFFFNHLTFVVSRKRNFTSLCFLRHENLLEHESNQPISTFVFLMRIQVKLNTVELTGQLKKQNKKQIRKFPIKWDSCLWRHFLPCSIP